MACGQSLGLQLGILTLLVSPWHVPFSERHLVRSGPVAGVLLQRVGSEAALGVLELLLTPLRGATRGGMGLRCH